MTAKADAKSKVCSRCDKRKRLDKFGKNAAHSDGLQSDCNDCRKLREATYRANRALEALPAPAGSDPRQLTPRENRELAAHVAGRRGRKAAS